MYISEGNVLFIYTAGREEAAVGIISLAKIVSQFLALHLASRASSKTTFVAEVLVVVVIRSILFPSFRRKGFERALRRHVAREMHSEILKIYFPPAPTPLSYFPTNVSRVFLPVAHIIPRERRSGSLLSTRRVIERGRREGRRETHQRRAKRSLSLVFFCFRRRL